jgi:DNA-binding IclR family transcriptional regulator
MSPVKSAQRVIDIFELYAARGEPATLTTIAAELKMPKSSCLALLTTLSAGGYLYEVRPQAGYYPTRRWLDKAQVISAKDPLADKIHQHLTLLREQTGETLIFGKRADDRVVYLEVVESLETLRYTAVAGQFKPLYATASGKAVLSAMSNSERQTFIGKAKLRRLTQKTIIDPAALERDIRQGIARGWQVSRGENVADATAVAVPILLMQEIFVLVVAGPSQRLQPHITAIGERLRKARIEIEEAR